jgi:hypothetical protein
MAKKGKWITFVLPKLPPDPRPTEDELEPYIKRAQWLPERWRRFSAKADWSRKKKEEDPNLFLAAFPSFVWNSRHGFGGFPNYESYRKSDL